MPILLLSCCNFVWYVHPSIVGSDFLSCLWDMKLSIPDTEIDSVVKKFLKYYIPRRVAWICQRLK